MDTGKSLKVYVQVKVDFREDGVMLPREIIWEDGVTYEIDCVVDIRQAAAMKAGGQGADTPSSFVESGATCFLSVAPIRPGII